MPLYSVFIEKIYNKNLPKDVEENLIAEVQRLCAQVAYLKNLQALALKEERHQHKKTQAIQKLRQEFNLALLLEIAELSQATFYYHLKRMSVKDKYIAIKTEIISIYGENKSRYGYRRITLELRNRVFCLNHKTVQLLMKKLGLTCRVRIKNIALIMNFKISRLLQ